MIHPKQIHHVAFPAMLVLLVTALSHHSFGQERSGRIHGTVKTKDHQTAIPFAEVFIRSLQRGDVTSESGAFMIEEIPPGEYELIARRQGFEAVKIRIEVRAAEMLEIDVSLRPTVLTMDELLVTASRQPNLEQEVAQMVSVVSAREISQRQVQHTPELLREEPGVLVQKTNQGGGSPNIRGYKANKVLLMVDGIRLNNSTYRGGNVQYLGTVDSEALESIEVVHGPGTSLYGSDALGGVINLLTKSPELRSGGGYHFGFSSSAMVSTADESRLTSVGLSAANSRWGIRLDASIKSFGNVTRGDNGGDELMHRLANDSRTARVLNEEQAPNSYDTIDGSLKGIFKLGVRHELTASYQINRQEAVPRYDVVEVLSDSVRLFDPQERDLIYLSYKKTAANALYDFATATLSWHRQFERRVRQKFGSSVEQRDQFRTLTYGAQLQFNKMILGSHHLIYGAEVYYDRVATASSEFDHGSGETNKRAPIFPDGSTFASLGVFAQGELELKSYWEVVAGIRFSSFDLNAPFDDQFGELNFGTVQQSFSNLTGSLSSRLKVADGVSLTANLSQGFRAPNLDDASKLGPGKGASFYDVPNPAVGPEKNLNFDGGLKVANSRFRSSIIGFYNHIEDLLIRRPTTFNGSDFIIDGNDFLAVFHKENAGEAFITGVAASAELSILPKVNVIGNVSYAYGQNTTLDEPLSSIPPFTGLAGLRWQATDRWFEINARFASAQERLSLEDQQDLRIPEGGTPGWLAVNLRGGLRVLEQVGLRMAVNNILDRNYREHTSGLNAPGRNFIVGADLRL